MVSAPGKRVTRARLRGVDELGGISGEQLTPERAKECEMSFKRSRIGACEGLSLGQPDRCLGDDTGMELKM